MLQSLNLIGRYKRGDLTVLKSNSWLRYLALAQETNINMERVDSIEELHHNLVLNYVERTLTILDQLTDQEDEKTVIEEVLIWSEVAKCGMAHHRKRWIAKGYNLFVHNIGSAEIYQEETDSGQDKQRAKLVFTLIYTHGLIGQAIRGEVPIKENEPLTALLNQGLIDQDTLFRLLYHLNQCIISGVSVDLWRSVQTEAEKVIKMIVDRLYREEYQLADRLKKLRAISIHNGENFQKEYDRIFAFENVLTIFQQIFATADLWFVEAALYDFNFEEFVKVFLLLYRETDLKKVKHISFEKLMKGLYYQHEGKKRINIYKKRVIEKYLAGLTVVEIINGVRRPSPHAEPRIEIYEQLDDTVFFDFDFSAAGEKLIDFCTEAEKADLLYEKAVILLFDLFELRKDKFDRFYDEEKYLVTMNRSVDYKKIILDYLTGENILDIGPGGGVLLDLIEEKYPDKKVTGIDFSQNVVDTLEKKKEQEKRKWRIIYGDALNLTNYLKPSSINTVIFCSIIHELYSYIEYEGKRFNLKTIATALKSAFAVLAPGGRIIIRDGIMSEPVEQNRIIKFQAEEGLHFLMQYANDFKGRKIKYKVIGQNEVLMPVNDAMEFLYTYTWGEKSYAHEVNEQFGYFTPGEYVAFIKQTLGDQAKIIECKHFLQDGYTTALSSKVCFFGEDMKPTALPDSTCILVVEKLS